MSSQSDRDERKNRRSVRKEASQRQAKRRRQFTVAGVAGLAVLIALGLILVPKLGGSSSNNSTIKIADSQSTGIPKNGKVLGDPNAPVKIVEYGNYQ